jgi:hypothetical protein
VKLQSAACESVKFDVLQPIMAALRMAKVFEIPVARRTERVSRDLDRDTLKVLRLIKICQSHA